MTDGSGSFTFTRRDPSLTGLNYIYEYTNDLATFVPFAPLNVIDDQASPVGTVTIMLPEGIADDPRLYIRVRAE